MKAFLLTGFVCLCASGAWAQSVLGSGVISGKVLDEDGVGMPDAEVRVENDAAALVRTAATSMDGVFEIVGLPPVTGYRVRITHQRYLEWNREDIEVPAGGHVNFDVVLQPEAAAAQSKPVRAANWVDRTTKPVGIVIDTSQVQELPTANRRWDALALLSPLVNASPADAAPAIRGDAVSNAWYTDGILATNSFSARRSVPAGPVAQDAVQGIEVLASGAPAEFGHAKGGAVNVITRGGGPAWHGGVYEYFSNSGLNALDRYAQGNKLTGKRNQGGFNLGGRVPNTYVFGFTNVEFWDNNGQALNGIANPLITGGTGSQVAANCDATAAQCAAAATFIGNQMNVLAPRSEHGVSGLMKLDYRDGERNFVSLSGYASNTRTPSIRDIVSTGGGLLGGSHARVDTHYGKLAWLAMPSPSTSNELRVSLFHESITNTASDVGLSTGRSAISLAGTTLGEPNAYSGTVHERRMNLTNNLRVSADAHTFLIGIDWTRTHDAITDLANATGTYDYPSLTAFAQDLAGAEQGHYAYYTQMLGNSDRNLRSSEFAFYLQDAWRISRRLQITAGVRWSRPFLPQPTEYNETYYQTGDLHAPNINADPRIGAAYLLDSRTVLRASFGMYHAPHPGELIDALFVGNGIYQSSLLVTPDQTGAPLLPNALTSDTIPGGTLNLMYAASKLRSPYTKQSTVSLERYLAGGVTLSASYAGSRGLKLWTVEDGNSGTAYAEAAYSILDAAGQSADTYNTLIWTTRADTDYAHIYQVTNGGSSWYRALAVQATKRMSHGFSARASYTWSHAIDDVGGPLVAGGVPLSYYNYAYRSDTGSSALDQRHRATIDGVWQPRFLKSSSIAARYLVNGWTLSSIATFASGLPATAQVVVNGQQFSDVATAFPGSLNGLGGWSRVPFLPVSSLRMEPAYVVNARLTRALPFTERIAGTLVFEAFNLFNSQYNTGVNTIAYVATGGVLTPVSGFGAGNAARGEITGSNARSCRIAFRLTF